MKKNNNESAVKAVKKCLLSKLKSNQYLLNKNDIHKFLHMNILDHLILTLNGQILLEDTILMNQEKITDYDQFLYVLDEFFSYFYKNFFWVHSAKNIILEEILKSKFNHILLCKIYLPHCNREEIYYKEFKKMIIDHFYMNFFHLFQNYFPFISYGIDLKKINFEDLDEHFFLLKQISLSLAFEDDKSIIFLFKRFLEFTQLSLKYEEILAIYHRKAATLLSLIS